MKAFIALLCVAAASAQPWWYAAPTMYTMPVKTALIKPEEYTKTMEYKTGMPMMYAGLYNNWAWPNMYAAGKLVDMPKIETDYAAKGEYRAEAAGGVVHVAKRDAEAILPYYNQWALPYMTSAWANPIAYTQYPYIYPVMPKMVHDDRQKEDTPEYANKGEYVAESAGVVHLAKREADAQVFLANRNILSSNIAYTTGIQRPIAFTSAIQRPVTYSSNILGSRILNNGIQRPITYSSNILGSRILNNGMYYL